MQASSPIAPIITLTYDLSFLFTCQSHESLAFYSSRCYIYRETRNLSGWATALAKNSLHKLDAQK